ncbi:MAG TPA: lipid-A-disaccharide synthase [Ferruginibacter sp.]|nr:lipid-A-disaccharide synthase [Ferruginibacter sp.]
MKYYIIAGEASGDLHGSNLIRELRKRDTAADIRCWGGDKMEAAGATLVKHYKDLAFMGFLEVIRNLGTIIQNIKACKEDILQYKPTTLILIDYPGFNLRIAKWAKEQGIPVIYYISPQVWAWKENRVKLIRKCVDLMLVILPFEKAFYQKWDYEVKYVGHPLVEVVDDFLNSDKGVIRVEDERKETIALLPGSRKQEILKKLPIMLDVAKHFPNYQFVVAKAPGLDEEFYAGLLEPYKNVSSVADKTYALLVRSKAALVTSGTATLETALFGVPEVICYKGSSFSYQIAKRLISIKYIGLVNLIMDKEVVKELIQDKLTVENLKHELNLLLTDEAKKMQIRQDYDALKKLLGQGGHASSNAADAISGFMEKLPQ